MQAVKAIGLDITKSVFQVHGTDAEVANVADPGALEFLGLGWVHAEAALERGQIKALGCETDN
jgi:hypothetical protein